MSKLKVFPWALALLFLFAAAGTRTAFAQSNISNVPTTDIVPEKKIEVEFQYLLQAPAPDALADGITPRTSVYVPRFTFGVGHNIEVGTNVSFLHVNGSGTTSAFLSPNVKWRFYDDESKGLAASGGALLFTPLNHREESKTFGMVYTNLSKTFKASYSPRLTGGFYSIVGQGDAEFNGPRAGALLGFEQPLSTRFKAVADWVSGKNGFGYFTPGVRFVFNGGSRLTAGYSFGNDSFGGAEQDRNNRFLFVKYGVTF